MKDIMDKTTGQEGSKDHLHLPLHIANHNNIHLIKYKPRYKHTQTYTKMVERLINAISDKQYLTKST